MKVPQVIRERTSRLAQGRIACALVLDRDVTAEEIARFQALPAGEEPPPERFAFLERVVRYECDEADEPRWRLAFEIFLTKTFSPDGLPPSPPVPPRPRSDTRSQAGLRKLHLG